MICPNCKKTYTEDNVFCVDCGTRLVYENNVKTKETPIERFSNRVKTSKPKTEEYPNKPKDNRIELSNSDNKLDVIIQQNRELIKQNKRIIDLLEKLVN